MPLIYFNEVERGTRLGVWKIEEPNDFFLSQLELTAFDRNEIAKYSLPIKLREWLSSRFVLKLMANKDEPIELHKDEFDKPHIVNFKLNCSISHCPGYAAAFISDRYRLGIDIEGLHEKVNRIAARFMSRKELSNVADETRIEQFVIHWSAKESLYKLYGRKRLDFKENLIIHPFKYEGKGQIETSLRRGDFKVDLNLNYQTIDRTVLTWVVDEP